VVARKKETGGCRSDSQIVCVMNFGDIIGQKNVIKSLKNSIINNMVSHAYIFEGPEGIGKKTVSSVFANALLCESGQAEPCQHCRSCVKYSSKNHPDIKTVMISDSAFIGVDAIREFRKDVYIKPYESLRKIYIINDADKMTVQAQNSLLKVLEEPPEYAVIILNAVNASLLLPTILSRAVLIRFQVHPNQEVERFLRRDYPHLDELIPFISMFSGGVIGKAKAIAESEQFHEMRQKLLGIIMDLLDTSEKKILDDVVYFLDNKQHIDVMMDILVSWFRDILFMKELHHNHMVINIDKQKELSAFSQKVSRRAVVKIVDRILDIKKKISMNANYNLAIETMLIQSWEEIHGRSSGSQI